VKIRFVFIALFTSHFFPSYSQKVSPDRLQIKIDSILTNSQFNGVVLLQKEHKKVYSNTIGFSDLENKTPLKLSDQFVIGSISKQITAVLVLKEYEKGSIQLQDKISIYLKDIMQPWANEVTIHQLLTHTHGITAIDQPLEFEAGTEFHYSQLGYELLSQLLEKVSGKSFQTLSTELFKKHKLKNTFHPENKNYKHLVKAYEENDNGVLEFSANSLDNYVAAAAFISNAEDLIKWNQLLHTGKMVDMETLETMKTKYATRLHPIFNEIDYGYGLLFKDGEQNIEIGALGYVPGFVTASYFYPTSRYNLVILQNTATELSEFKKTFKVHSAIMELVKIESRVNN
jgi:D-alanyl-D-alanine carboxypeptidase